MYNPIGIFDSGIGGLTIAHALKEKLPKESIIYFGDTEHLPYGRKSNKAICNFSKAITSFLKSKNCKAIIIACNSASSVAYKEVIKFAGGIPVFNVIDPVINYVSKHCKNSIVGVIGTKATINSNIYFKKITTLSSNIKVKSLATPLLAPMIEEGFINQKISKAIIENYLSNKKLKSIDNIILACTHYSLISDEIDTLYNKKINIIDSPNIISNNILTELKKLNLTSNLRAPSYHFYVSNYTESFENSARVFFQENIKLEGIKIWH
ncbi:MAG: glutamate racemase [Bacteroidota bacterium]|nr:glutamate racemase [Bacteroidota bacterium]